jgi:hypothetical protein
VWEWRGRGAWARLTNPGLCAWAAEGVPWKKLATAVEHKAAREDSDELIHTRPDSDEPNDAAGRLVNFSYCDAKDEVTVRTVQVKHCWYIGDVLYVRGECQLRHAIRTFRADRMANLHETKSDRRIADPVAYFAHFADTPPPGWDWPPEAPHRGIVRRGAVHRDLTQSLPWHTHHQARRVCIDGLRVIAYTALCGKGWSEPDRNIEQSYVEARLAMAGFERNVQLTAAMMEIGDGLAPPFSSFITATNRVAEDRQHFQLVRDCVTEIVDIDGATATAAEAEAYHRLMAAAAACGYQ